MSNILDPSACEVLDKLEKAEEAASAAAGYVGQRLRICIEVGNLLLQKKLALGHGEWLKWFEQSISNSEVALSAAFSYQTARKWMRLSEINDRGILDLDNATSVRQAYMLAGLLPSSESNSSHDEGSTSSNLLVKLRRIETLLQSELTRRPLKDWPQEERKMWSERLKPLLNLYDLIQQ